MLPFWGFWSRDLVFPTQSSASTTAPMWDRHSTRTPVFLPSIPPPSQMWSRPSTGNPIFVSEPVVGSKPMWDRSGSEDVSSCPCCLRNTETSLRGIVVYGDEFTRGSSSSRDLKTEPLWNMPGGWKGRLKKRFRRPRSITGRSSDSDKGLLV
ncbi:hypothetical protein DL546_007852 [Coniochaeta pulveracea]|uniref:Uncharacterized protein n=1 Tax=Coniochaeta pulveracea TaxID=177199 RepID=A0A420YH47_9PEZI|nr:hypothetical protein DL546_007852 [Coniochaeta pulveracea]